MEQNTILIIVGSCLLACLICYIIALVKSKRGEMVFTANGWDMTLLLACPIFFFIGWCGGMEPPIAAWQIVLWGISALCLLGTVIFSFVSNWDSAWRIIVSVLAKFFVVFLTLFVIFLLIVITVFYVMSVLMSNNKNEDDYIILKYDKFMKAYVGYRV